MIKINKILLCDNFSAGQFGKFNLYNLIFQDSIAIPFPGYMLTTNLVILGSSRTIDINLELILKFYNEAGDETGITSFKIDDTSIVKKSSYNLVSAPFSLFIRISANLVISNYGKMIFHILNNKIEIYQETYYFSYGEAPILNTTNHLPQSKSFLGTEDGQSDYILNLLAAAHKSLKIFDSYLTPDSLENLLSKVLPQTEIAVITRPDQTRKKIEDKFITKNLSAKFPNLQIRFSERIHDRYVILNEAVYYHFGHSLKDATNTDKLSRCSQIIDSNELESVKAILTTIEEAATPLK